MSAGVLDTCTESWLPGYQPESWPLPGLPARAAREGAGKAQDRSGLCCGFTSGLCGLTWNAMAPC